MAIQPRISIAQPPPPDAVRATAPARAPAASESAQGPVKPTAPPDYLRRLAAYLNSYKSYPYGARRRREQGSVRLHFVMDRDGHVLSFQLVGSSGWADLDDEAVFRYAHCHGLRFEGTLGVERHEAVPGSESQHPAKVMCERAL